jgi:hypothetical protein
VKNGERQADEKRETRAHARVQVYVPSGPRLTIASREADHERPACGEHARRDPHEYDDAGNHASRVWRV